MHSNNVLYLGGNMGNFVDTREGEKLERKQEYKAEL
jgi:hypothetical protein